MKKKESFEMIKKKKYTLKIMNPTLESQKAATLAVACVMLMALLLIENAFT